MSKGWSDSVEGTAEREDVSDISSGAAAAAAVVD